MALIEKFAATAAVLTCGIATSKEYGRIKGLLRKVGNPIPENDIWIAALATENELTLVTRDAHFTKIEGIKRIKW